MAEGQLSLGQIDGLLNVYAPSPSAGAALGGMVVVAASTLRSVRCGSVTTGASPTVLDVLRNGASIWKDSSRRPTIGATHTRDLAPTQPDLSALQPGDVLLVTCASAGGHGGVVLTAALERP